MVLVDHTGRVPHDLSTVGLNEDWEVQYWCSHYGVGDDVLRSCVAEVGPRTVDIERRLRETGAGKAIFGNMGED